MISTNRVSSCEPAGCIGQIPSALSSLAAKAIEIISLPIQAVKKLCDWAWSHLFPAESTKVMSVEPILDKMRQSVMAGKIETEHKLTLAEFVQLRRLEESTQKDSSLFKAYEALLADQKHEPYIRISLHRADQLPWECGKIQKIVNVVSNWFKPFKHVNIIMNDGKTLTAHSLTSEGIYHKDITGRFHPKFVTHDIDVERLMPAGIQPEQKKVFTTKFYEELAKIITSEGEGLNFPKHPLQRYFWGLVPTLTQPVELFLDKKEKRELFCSEFVLQALVEAHVRTCNALKLTAHESLSSFGIRNLYGLSPDQMQTALLAKKIIKPAHQPLQDYSINEFYTSLVA